MAKAGGVLDAAVSVAIDDPLRNTASADAPERRMAKRPRDDAFVTLEAVS